MEHDTLALEQPVDVDVVVSTSTDLNQNIVNAVEELTDAIDTAAVFEDDLEEQIFGHDEADDVSSEAVVIKPVSAAQPLPDLRFEESYLRAVSAAKGNWWKIAYITVRDQVFMPLVQGTIWSFLLLSASSLRAASGGSGRYYGSGVVRWWRSINPPPRRS